MRRVSEIEISGLQDAFDYHVKFPPGNDNVILIAPNGYGKTALLAVLNSCLQFRLRDAARLSFRCLDVVFDDGSRWSFAKTEEIRNGEHEKTKFPNRGYPRRLVRRREWVKFTSFDKLGSEVSAAPSEFFLDIPPDLLYRALDRALPIVREEYDAFRDMNTGELSSASEIFEKYWDRLVDDEDFKSELGPRFEKLMQSRAEKINCVFIETQRLLLSKSTPSAPDGVSPERGEEITRQSAQLSAMLQGVYSNYASISQGLDRSFPSRLISRAASAGPREAVGLRADLDEIEERRKLLIAAGLLVDSSEPLVAPKDEFINNVADALSIYVEDSRAKLGTFDDIYNKVSVFRDLLNKKLRPKELVVSRQVGALVKKGGKDIRLEGLSSGEKHEFIMLFKLIFETPHHSLVLIDEPEISLHVLWQLEFMSDLQSIQGANPFQSIIATHSPQIFQGVEGLIVDLAEQVQ